VLGGLEREDMGKKKKNIDILWQTGASGVLIAGIQLSWLLGKQFDLIVDFVGADYCQKNLDASSMHGRMAVL